MLSLRSITSLLGVAVLVAACSETGPEAYFAPAEDELLSTTTSTTSGMKLVECPTNTTRSSSGTVGPLGGSLSLDGHEIVLPALAVLAPTELRLEAPASNYLELTIHANGADSFEFEKAVTVTIDYSRCTRSNIDKAPLTVWQIDPDTKELLEHMGGDDDKEGRTVTFRTDHLSTYSIAR